MRKMTLAGLVLIANFPVLALGEVIIPDVDSYALRMECSTSYFSQVEVRDCLAEKAKNSFELLKETEDMTLGTLSNWDEDSPYIKQSRAKLIQSNKSFALYRETQCEYSASLSGGGAGHAREMGRLACIAELNYRRAKQLRAEVSALPLK